MAEWCTKENFLVLLTAESDNLEVYLPWILVTQTIKFLYCFSSLNWNHVTCNWVIIEILTLISNLCIAVYKEKFPLLNWLETAFSSLSAPPHHLFTYFSLFLFLRGFFILLFVNSVVALGSTLFPVSLYFSVLLRSFPLYKK